MIALVCFLLLLYEIAIFGTIILSWFPVQPGSGMAQVTSFLWRITDPVLGPIRRTVPALQIGGAALDLSPIIVLIGIQILRAVICH